MCLSYGQGMFYIRSFFVVVHLDQVLMLEKLVLESMPFLNVFYELNLIIVLTLMIAKYMNNMAGIKLEHEDK